MFSVIFLMLLLNLHLDITYFSSSIKSPFYIFVIVLACPALCFSSFYDADM